MANDLGKNLEGVLNQARIAEVKFAPDSLVEGNPFEPSVPGI
jgi:hypothetical protein